MGTVGINCRPLSRRKIRWSPKRSINLCCRPLAKFFYGIEDELWEDEFLNFAPDWSIDRYQFDNDCDYAEAVWGIPDPRLVED